ncbi:hypothetical protein [Methanolapillus millepedarum]|uniref:Uncharacterized protein n=1 Tax=Methanolapillus millepedarum TaxID=3028296 RepID=A0AA96V5B7_9EURY|nr:hypothetical protein MsAc7_17730 [Methanosarcinaceae archaeon Ac7]
MSNKLTNFLKDRSLEVAYNPSYYDLIEYRKGAEVLHTPAPLLLRKSIKMFNETVKRVSFEKARTGDFFSCKYCGDKSFYKCHCDGWYENRNNGHEKKKRLRKERFANPKKAILAGFDIGYIHEPINWDDFFDDD